VLSVALLAPRAGAAEEAPTPAPATTPPAPAPPPAEFGANRSYLIPALEVGGFIFGLNQFNRHFIDKKEYGSDGRSIRRNLEDSPQIDKDPFSINQLGHPYQGTIYYGLARSAGLNYWQSLLYTLGGAYAWEIAGETTRPSINDIVNSGIGGTFLGEPLFRMASLLLEGGGEAPGFWRELGAALLSPGTGFNRLVFGDRFDAIFPSRDPAVFFRLRFGGTLTTSISDEALNEGARRQEGFADYSMIYGLPGKPGYRYTRPFDYFQFDLTAVPNASSFDDALENVSTRGLLVGAPYAGGENVRGVWGLFGSFDYLSPQVFRVSTTALSVGTTLQWWLSRAVALQGTAIGGFGFGASGTVGDRAERDYHYGVAPQTILGARLIFGDRAMLDVTGRQFYVAGKGSGGGVSTSNFGQEIITRTSLGATVRVWGPHALGFQYLLSTRDAQFARNIDRHQSVETMSLTYTFLGRSRFGAVEWRPEVLPDR
jgi:hypothetical protein